MDNSIKYSDFVISKLEEDRKKWVFCNLNLEPMDIMIVGQNPGNLKSEDEEFKAIESARNPEELITAYRDGLIEYFGKSKAKYLVAAIQEIENILNIDLHQNLNNFFDTKKIFFTDLIKRRGMEIKKPELDEENLFNLELREVKPKIIFCFGSIALAFFQEKFTDNRRLQGKITDLCNMPILLEKNTYLFPLLHYSCRFRKDKVDESKKALRSGLVKYKEMVFSNSQDSNTTPSKIIQTSQDEKS